MPKSRYKKAKAKAKKTGSKVKKRVKKFAETVVERAERSDLLPDVPGPDPVINAVATIAALHPAVRLPLAGYMLAENTEHIWGPRVYGTADKYMDWYEKNVRDLYAGTEIDPRSPLGYYPPRMGPMGPPAPEPQKAKRKVSKANKATSRAYKFLKNGVKGKMTQKKCCDLLKKAQMMASKANPNTKSRIGKGRSKNKTECRKMRKSIWGTTKRY